MKNINSKIYDVKELRKILDVESQIGKSRKIGFTNGCFDIIHLGHLNYLKQSKDEVDILVVGINSDRSVKKLKGPNRPINNERDRASFLLYLYFVDYVTIFDEDTPEKVIDVLKPTVLFKGADYNNKEIVGSKSVLANGGTVSLKKYLAGYSTTSLIEKIRARL